jgi:SAM-dependent methyltransferase
VIGKFIRWGYGWVCERLYREFAWSYDLVSRGVSAGQLDVWRRIALDEVQQRKATTQSMLEIGFGTGALLAMARRASLPVVGLELSPQMHAVASATLARQQLDAPRVQGTATAMPFADESFDVVISTFPTPYILKQSTLRECARVLRKHGRLIIVGLWVTPVICGRRLHMPPMYGAPSPAQQAGVGALLEDADFTPMMILRRAGGAEVSVVIGEKRAYFASH